MTDSKAIELWQATNKLLERIAKALEKRNEKVKEKVVHHGYHCNCRRCRIARGGEPL